jgi:hypothetical protein
MNAAQTKLLVWGVVVALAAGTLSYLGLTFMNRDLLDQRVTTERMQQVLSNVPEVEQRQENMISGKLVDRGLKLMDWSGKPPPEVPVAATGPEDNRPPPKESVASLLKISAIRYHGDAPANSEVVIKYTSAAQVPPGKANGSYLKRVGDMLDGRLNQIKIAMIYPTAVEFTFDNEPGREHEFVEKEPFDLAGHFAILQPGQEPQRLQRDIERYVTVGDKLPPPGQTQRITPTKFRLGTEDAAFIDQNYPEILTQEVSIENHRDPRTKQFDGIQVKGVKPDSIAARHGIQDGDVIKSINGHAVTSKEDAINFVKRNKDQYTEWVVEIWNKGQTRTVTYYPPKK